jgi:hypothetical protein
MIITRNLTIIDMIDVKDFIAEHTLMYGVAFDHDIVLSRYRNCIMNHDAVGAYENDVLIGICTTKQINLLSFGSPTTPMIRKEFSLMPSFI